MAPRLAQDKDKPTATDQRCASCGQRGQPPTIGKPRPNDLTIRPFLGRLELICRECLTVIALDRAARRPRP